MDLSCMLQSILSEDGGAMGLSAVINNNRLNTQRRRKKLNIERSQLKNLKLLLDEQRRKLYQKRQGPYRFNEMVSPVAARLE